MEADGNKVRRQYFSVESKVTPDKYVKSMLKKTYESEFIKPYMRFTGVISKMLGDVPYDDQVFLRLMEQETAYVNNLYEALLPLNSTDVTFPNNKSAARIS